MYKSDQIASSRIKSLIPAIEWCLSTHAEYEVWPKAGTVAAKFGVSKLVARHALDYAELSLNDPDRYALILNLPEISFEETMLNPESVWVRKLVHQGREALTFVLEIHSQFGGWPRYGTVAHKYNLSKNLAKDVVEIAKLSVSDPTQFSTLMSLLPPTPKANPRRKPRIGEYYRQRPPPRSHEFSKYLDLDEIIYFILMPTMNAVKIGYTKGERLPARFSTIQSGNPTKLKLLIAIPGGRVKERELHQQFIALHVGVGEWFIYESPLIEFIESLR